MRYLITCILLICSIGAYAAKPMDTSYDSVSLIGTGHFSCGKFVEYRNQNNQEQLNIIVQWVWGFLSAYNYRGFFSTSYQGRLPQIDLPDYPTVLLYLETHCLKRPTDRILDATFALIKELNGPIAWKK